MKSQTLKNDECTYYIQGMPAFSIERQKGKLTITKWFEPFNIAILSLPNEMLLYTEGGDEWFGLRTVSDIKMLAFGADTFVVPDHILEELNLKGGDNDS